MCWRSTLRHSGGRDHGRLAPRTSKGRGVSAEHHEHHPEDGEHVRELEAELEKILREAESTVVELRRELAEQRQRRLQHEEIERFEEHLANSRVRWEEVRDYFQEVLHEIRGQEGPERTGGAEEESEDDDERR